MDNKPEQFADEEDKDAHKRFQKWRQRHEAGWFINCFSDAKGMLHRALCRHHGNTAWPRGSHSLTRRKKVCSPNRKELVKWAENQHMTLQMCNDCDP